MTATELRESKPYILHLMHAYIDHVYPYPESIDTLVETFITIIEKASLENTAHPTFMDALVTWDAKRAAFFFADLILQTAKNHPLPTN